jgi:hypothetical protein
MKFLFNLCRSVTALIFYAAAPLAWAAAPAEIGIEASEIQPSPAPIASLFELETEMVVHNWVLCTSQDRAEQLVRAREESLERAQSAYADLKQSRSCGQFPELRVILRERLYVTTADSGHDARIFGALVNFADAWASAFVVYGSLPEK